MPICFANAPAAEERSEAFLDAFMPKTGHVIVVPELDYAVEVTGDPYQIFVVPHELNMPGARFQHPNVLATLRKSSFGYKHYHPTRGKWWTYRDGVEHFFIVPKEHVYLDDSHKGYGYPKLIVNGERFSVNVGGGMSGTSGMGRTDYIGAVAETSVGLPVRIMRKLAEVSVLHPDFQIPIRDDQTLITHDELLVLLAKPRYPDVGDVVITNGKPNVLSVTKVDIGRNGHRIGYVGTNGYGSSYRFRQKNVKDIHRGLSPDEVIDLFVQHQEMTEEHAEFTRAIAQQKILAAIGAA